MDIRERLGLTLNVKDKESKLLASRIFLIVGPYLVTSFGLSSGSVFFTSSMDFLSSLKLLIVKSFILWNPFTRELYLA